MALTAAVAGGSGYAGGELLRLLHAHPDFRIGPVAAGRHTGVAITDVHPHLIALTGQHFVETGAHTLGQADVVFLALPHGESGTLVSQLPNDCLVVDLGADFRLTDANAWQKYYGGEHAGTWVYGLPELPGARTAIAQSTRVANPGCFPTGIIVGLAPLLAADLVEHDVLDFTELFAFEIIHVRAVDLFSCDQGAVRQFRCVCHDILQAIVIDPLE